MSAAFGSLPLIVVKDLSALCSALELQSGVVALLSTGRLLGKIYSV